MQRSLDKDPARRHPTATEFYEDLVRSFGVDSTTSNPDLPTSPDGEKTRADKPASIASDVTVVSLDPTPAVLSPVGAPLHWAWVAVTVGALVLVGLLVWILS